MAEEKGDEARCGSHGAPTVEEGRTARATAVAAAAAGAPAASEAQRGTEAPTAEEAEGESTETHAAAETSAEADGGCIGAPTVTATGPGNFAMSSSRLAQYRALVDIMLRTERLTGPQKRLLENVRSTP